MALSKEQVQKIAHLARLKLTESEVDKFAKQLSAVLDYAEILKEVNTDNIEPIAQITGLKNVTFSDEVIPCDFTDALLKQSPQSVQDNMIKVKSVFE